MRLVFATSFFLVAGAVAAFSCSGSGSQTDTLCQPKDNYFCRCKGGAEGTKTCKSSGMGFDNCVNSRGEDCTEIVDTSSSSSYSSPSSSSSYDGVGGTSSHAAAGTGGDTTIGAGGSSVGGGSTGTKQIYESCCDGNGCYNDQCASGMCLYGFCTQTCTDYTECAGGPNGGDCITIESQTVCLPYCSQTGTDCETPYGAPSTCGYTLTADMMFSADVCADWLSGLQPAAVGTSCMSTTDCNLGNAGLESVCGSGGTCETGCFGPSDCPSGMTCSTSNGTTVGQCN